MTETRNDIAPESSAVRVALWRALHVQVDAMPHVLEDEIGLKLLAPDANWRQRPDMDPLFTRGYRASIVGRSRFVEDFVAAQAKQGVTQYVLLGAGLDTFAQRRPEIAAKMRIFEVDRPGPQSWKRQRLVELGYGVPDWLKLVPVDFEAGQSWSHELAKAGFDPQQPAVVASTGVSMYLTQEANLATLREIARFARGSTFLMTFLLTLDLIASEERAQHQMVYERAKAAGTPFLSFFTPTEIQSLAKKAGFRKTEDVSTPELTERYFSGRTDGFQPSTGEEFLVATT